MADKFKIGDLIQVPSNFKETQVYEIISRESDRYEIYWCKLIQGTGTPEGRCGAEAMELWRPIRNTKGGDER